MTADGGYDVSATGKGMKWTLAAPELYDLADEPAEEHNLAAERPEMVAQLSSLLERYRTQGFSRPNWIKQVTP